MKVMVTGSNGLLGFDVVNTLSSREYCAVGIRRDELDITDYLSSMNLIEAINPDVIIHCAAWTDVEQAEIYPNEAHKVNVEGTKNIAKAAKKISCKMVYISTDYVFDGNGNVPYSTESKQLFPVNVYGATKLEAERVIEEYLNK